MSQVRTRGVKLKTIMYSRAFMRGYNEVIAGMPFNPDYDNWRSSDQWSYERGRHYAILSGGHNPPKFGNRINHNALLNYAELNYSGEII